MYVFDLKTLGERIKRYRVALNMTQVELANRAGISERTLKNCELTGRTTTNHLRGILIALGRPNELAQLLSGDPQPVPQNADEFIESRKLRQRARRKKVKS
jgi:transcriptional regulator with XRE-family HTH domain